MDLEDWRGRREYRRGCFWEVFFREEEMGADWERIWSGLGERWLEVL